MDERTHAGSGTLTVFLGGDVMLGRGVDQVLAHPSDPRLWEPSIRDARRYVELAEAVNGPVPRPVEARWPWGDALEALDEAAPDVRIINLETSITRSDDVASGKSVHYRMHPDNVDALSVVRPDVVTLANNHVLDFGIAGLEETLDTLADAGLRWAGAGRDLEEARRPAVIPLGDGGRVLVFAVGMTSSGIPETWRATVTRPGVDLLDVDGDGTEELLDRVDRWERPGDVVVVSVHWGSNWGYDVTHVQTRIAHALVAGGVDVVHGHSSHHPRPVEVHRERLILYGCGDLVDDYEGIAGYEEYRDDLRLLHLVSLEPSTGRLVDLRMLPVQARRLRLHHADTADRAWLAEVLDRVSRPFGSGVAIAADGALRLTVL